MPDFVLVAVALPMLYPRGGPDVRGHALAAYDPDAHNGFGDAEWTDDPARAKRYPDAGAAMEEWRRTSTVRPIRPDGKPNRPLSAFTVSPIMVDHWIASLP